jgi:hypothetical protein
VPEEQPETLQEKAVEAKEAVREELAADAQ